MLARRAADASSLQDSEEAQRSQRREGPRIVTSNFWNGTLVLRGARGLAALAVALVVLSAALATRSVLDARLVIPQQGRWVTTDPDGLYHARRLERVAEEGLPVAETDPFLSYPDGSAIPWPPYYTLVAWTILGPWAGDEPARRDAFLERASASLPCAFGVATSLLAAIAAGILAGPLAALCAGLGHALCFGSIAYSRLGIGDHHAFVSLLSAAMFTLASAAFARGALSRRRSGLVLGALAGALAGSLLGTWVASLVDVVLFELVLALAMVAHGARPLAGLAPFGLAYHATALLVLSPALATSPWRTTHPWIVVNLSWFHALHLALGAAVFVPLFFLDERARLRRVYPWIVAGALLGLAAVILALPGGPGAGIREGFEWMSRENRFMATIAESRPLLGDKAGEGALFAFLGWAVLLAPPAWAWMAWRAWKQGELALLPWVVVFPAFLAQALAQRRFADSLALPLAVVLAWGLASLAAAGAGRRLSRSALAAASVIVVALSHWSGTLRPLFAELSAGERATPSIVEARSIGMRLACEWLRDRTPPGDYSVLAQWGHGHAIECVAERPTVATNFGTYVGVESFLDSLRYLLEEDPRSGEALLQARRVRYVLIDSDWPKFASVAIRTVFPERWDRYYEQEAVREAFFDTLGARLLFGGMRARAGSDVNGIDHLRLVHASPVPDPDPVLRAWSERMPCAFVYERVAGARLEARAEPGATLAVEIPLRYPVAGGAWPLLWSARAAAGADGRIELRIPYATTESNGEGRLAQAATWSLEGRKGTLVVSEAQVLGGTRLVLDTGID